ncbi:MAG: hypothetical protein EZS28_044763 [Streblomastix strix]|uniref:non-specific serine/threonine protein kinase n=1 Tax=Streblomastix strix TaxID=222440 RepID=A0A5J4TPB5_9EUKA|nr:MAG: hypothetical protein EZS28_044763 [Streblomastix strix]
MKCQFDFGLAQQLQIGFEYTTSLSSILLFQAPEFLRYERKDDKEKEVTFGITIEKQQEVISRPIQTPAVDIWSFGVMIFELLAQRHPFFDDKTEANISAGEFIFRVVNHQPAELPDHYPQILKNLIKIMLDKNPIQRIQAQGILAEPEIISILRGQ